MHTELACTAQQPLGLPSLSVLDHTLNIQQDNTSSAAPFHEQDAAALKKCELECSAKAPQKHRFGIGGRIGISCRKHSWLAQLHEGDSAALAIL